MHLAEEFLLEKQKAESRIISQKKASEECGVEYIFFHQVLHGKNSGQRRPEEFRKIANYFGMTDAELRIKWNTRYGKN